MGSWCVRVSPGRKDLFYFQHRTKQGLIEMHRFIMNFPKGKYVDHINHNTLDNRKCNLRICNNADNIRNGKIRTNNKSGYNLPYSKENKEYILADFDYHNKLDKKYGPPLNDW